MSGQALELAQQKTDGPMVTCVEVAQAGASETCWMDAKEYASNPPRGTYIVRDSRNGRPPIEELLTFVQEFDLREAEGTEFRKRFYTL